MPWKRVSPRRMAEFTLKNFATPIVFYIVFEWVGVKPAIAFAVSVAVVQVFAHLIFRWKPSLFFILATSFTVAFGGIDLLIATPRFFRLEGFAQNFCVGTIFLATLATSHSMIWRLAMSLPQEIRPDVHELDDRYLTRLTQIWAAYFYVKSVFFLYLAFRIDLGQLYLWRVIAGNASAVALFLGEFAYRKKFRRKRRPG